MDDLRFYVLFNRFQSYQDDDWVIMKDCVQWNLVFGWKDFFLKRGSNAGSVGQRSTYWATGAPGHLKLEFLNFRWKWNGTRTRRGYMKNLVNIHLLIVSMQLFRLPSKFISSRMACSWLIVVPQSPDTKTQSTRYPVTSKAYSLVQVR